MLHPHPATGYMKIVVAVGFTAALAGAYSVASTQERSAPKFLQTAQSDSDDIAAVFWRCDFQATQSLIGPGDAQDCSRATEALRITRFHGDFQAMLTWWQENKTAKHLALKRSSPAATSRRQ